MYSGPINLFTAGMVWAACLACFLIGSLFLVKRYGQYRRTTVYNLLIGVVVCAFGTMVGNGTAALGYAGLQWMPEAFLIGRLLQLSGLTIIVYVITKGQPGGTWTCFSMVAFSFLGGCAALLLKTVG
jgi:hypothetical protein